MKTNIAVVFGGRSTEHEISIISANQAMHALDENKYNIIPIFISKNGKLYSGEALLKIENYRNMDSLLEKCTEVTFRPIFDDHNLYHVKQSFFSGKPKVFSNIDIVIPVLHGANGEDGAFQGLLQTLGIPYVGCDVLSSANGMDKIFMKMILGNQNIPVIDFVWFTDKQWYKKQDEIINDIETKLSYPVIVKPSNLGSSVGIGRADNREELILKIKDAEKYSNRIIVEKLIERLKEINCSVLGDVDEYEMSVLEEPIKTGEILSYQDKYLGGSKGAKGMQASAKRIPADLSEEMTERIKYLAGETFRVLSCHGVSRIDFIIDETDNSIYVNEINTIPGSLSFYLWEATDLKFNKLMDRLVELALKRSREFAHKTLSFDQNIFAMAGSGLGTKGIKGNKI